MVAAVMVGMTTGQLRIHLNLNADKYTTAAQVRVAIDAYLRAAGIDTEKDDGGQRPMDVGAMPPGKGGWHGKGKGGKGKYNE